MLFSLCLVAIMLVIRKTVEFFWKNAPTSKLWNNLILVLLPILLGGGVGAIFKTYPYGAEMTSLGDHVVFGVVAGLVSGLLFKVIKGLLGNQIQNMVNSLSTQPTPTPVLPPSNDLGADTNRPSV